MSVEVPHAKKYTAFLVWDSQLAERDTQPSCSSLCVTEFIHFVIWLICIF